MTTDAHGTRPPGRISAAPDLLTVAALRNALFGPIDLSLAAGSCIAIRGPSGAGKSLLLRAIADLDPATGKVALNGVDRDTIPAFAWRRKVAYVPAETGWWADTVGEHFTAPDGPALMTWLDALGFTPDVLGWTVDRLSSGERHRLGLARSLALAPQVLMLDEPTATLDGEATHRVEALIARHLADGNGALVVTHDDGQPGRLGARILHMAAGRLRPA